MRGTAKLEYTSWWGTKGCSRGGIIFGNHRGTGPMEAVAATHSVVFVAVCGVVANPHGKKKLLASGAKQKPQSHKVGLSRGGIRPPSLGV